MATDIVGTTPLPNDLSAPSTPLSLSFTNCFHLTSTESMSSVHSLSTSSISSTPYCVSPILRDFQEMTLSITDEEDNNDERNNKPISNSLFVFNDLMTTNKIYTNDPHKNTKNEYNEDNDNDTNRLHLQLMENDSDLSDDENDENPFLMGLAINIPNTKSMEEMIEIESCDEDEDEYTNNYFVDDSDIEEIVDCDHNDHNHCHFDDDHHFDDIDRKFMMKKYKYIKNIGIGAFGIVDKVFHRKQNQYVAIKQSRSIGDEVLKQFKKEIVILKEFKDCKYIIDLIDFGRNIDANQICIGLEYMDIGSLQNIKKYAMNEIKYISKCILIALQTLHLKLYVHNDIKPENILISTNGDVKLIDFGCTMQMNNKYEPLTKSIGSIRYLSFEKRCKSPIQYNTKSDIYSFGITISELFNGEHCRKKTLYDHYFVTSSPKLKNNDNILFNDFISKCIEQDANKRFSATQLLQHPFLNDVPQQIQFTMH